MRWVVGVYVISPPASVTPGMIAGERPCGRPSTGSREVDLELDRRLEEDLGALDDWPFLLGIREDFF